MSRVVNLTTTPDLPCADCGTQLLLSASLPHPRLPGAIFTHTLCPRCHANDDSSQGLLAYFAVTPVAESNTIGTLGALIEEWISCIPAPPLVAPEAFEADVAAWHRGDFDN